MTKHTLFLAWQDRARTRRWYPIGRLDADIAKKRYLFRYTHGADAAFKEAAFAPLWDFPELRRTYESGDLFPLFQNRVMTPTRPDFSKYLEQLDLTPQQADPIEILSVTGGGRATDAFEVFPKLELQADGTFACRFFLHGSRHVNDFSQQRIERLHAGERLGVTLELTNPATRLAVQIQTEDYQMIGWAPRYLVPDLATAMTKSDGEFRAHVVRVNPSPAPSNQRVLVEFQGTWISDREPMSGEEFLPLVTWPKEAGIESRAN
jgi:hypothetical protein